MALLRKNLRYGQVFAETIPASSVRKIHCVKSVKIRSFFWSVYSRNRSEYGETKGISLYLVRIRENTDQEKLRIWTLFTQEDLEHA